MPTPLERLEAIDNLLIGILTRRVGDFRKALLARDIDAALADKLTEAFFQSAISDHEESIKIAGNELVTITQQILAQAGKSK